MHEEDTAAEAEDEEEIGWKIKNIYMRDWNQL